MISDASDPQPENVDDLLRTGIAAAKAGRRERARDLLMRVVEQDEKNVPAWLWLSGVVDDLDDRQICLENVLTLDPGNDAARAGLAWVRQKKAEAAGVSAGTDVTSGDVAAAEIPATSFVEERPASAPSSAEPATVREPAPQTVVAAPGSSSATSWLEFDNPYGCPYCATPTSPDDRRCQACGGELWFKVRRREERSPWLWTALVLQLSSTMQYAAVPVAMLLYAALKAGVYDPAPLLLAYFGLPNDIPLEAVDATLAIVPRLYILVSFVPVLLSLAMLIGLYGRWQPMFYVFLANAAMVLSLSVLGIAMTRQIGSMIDEMFVPLTRLLANPIVSLDGLARELMGAAQRAVLICSGGGVGAAMLMFLLGFRLDDDLFLDERRIFLRIDRGVTKGFGFLIHARRYAREKMWALAALHLQQATVVMPPGQIEGHTELAVAYMHLKRYDLAAEALVAARRIGPDDPRIAELTALLDSLRTMGNPL